MTSVVRDELIAWALPLLPGFAAHFDLLVDHVNQAVPRIRTDFETCLGNLPYDEFLESRYWHAVRLQIFKSRNGCCETCRYPLSVDGFQVHHTTYKHRGSEYNHLEDLKLLCSCCHAIITEAVRSMRGQL